MEPRKLEYTELTRIIIGTVVAAGDKGITPKQLTAQLNSWGINVTLNQMGARLHGLAEAGSIERVARGIYRGV